MIVEICKGKSSEQVDIPDKNLLCVLNPNEVEVSLTGDKEVAHALANPIGSKRLCEIVKPNEKIAIVTSDITRPMPTALVMPLLLDELYSAGVKKEDITLVFALGSHRFHTEEEKRKLAGERAMNEITVVDGDYNDCVFMGVTSNGTPVDIVRIVAEADRRICLGNIEYHYFAGYSGGSKAIMPGVSTRAAIQANHSKMVEQTACAGAIDTNPVRQDIEEATKICKIDFILNVVLDEHKQVIKAVAGDYILAHREGCKFLDTLYLKEIPARADIVIVSQGGYPKDINLYQTQKALDNAKHAVAKNGVIILVGSCAEGLGEHVFEEWMLNSPSPKHMIERIAVDFQLGGHKAAAIAMVLEDSEIYLVSDLEADFVKKIFMTPFDTVASALSCALSKCGNDASIIVMPYGGSTLPRVNSII